MKKSVLRSFAAIIAICFFTAGSSFGAAEVGKEAPAFTLVDQQGNSHSLSDFKGKYVILEWLNHGCPFVAKHYNAGNMQKLQKMFTEKDVVWLSIISSAPGKQGHMSGEEIIAYNTANNVAATAVLVDPTGTVGRAYDAKRTPEMYIINPEGVLVYHGAIDSESGRGPDSIKKAENYIVRAMTELFDGKPVSKPLTKPYGCTVKY